MNKTLIMLFFLLLPLLTACIPPGEESHHYFVLDDDNCKADCLVIKDMYKCEDFAYDSAFSWLGNESNRTSNCNCTVWVCLT